MISTDYLAELQQKMAEDFQSQNSELFDTVFEVEGKKLYAHKYRLSAASKPFKAMLSGQKAFKGKTIKIKNYGYDDFKEFLSFFYSGQCNLNDTNISTMLKLAQAYQINHLKKLCDEYSAKAKPDVSNELESMKVSSKYSMKEIRESIHTFIVEDFKATVGSDAFLKADKKAIIEIIKSNDFVTSEELFQAVYRWCEYRAIEKQSNNLNDSIKAEISPFLLYFRFKAMGLNFLHTFVVKRGFIFSYDELSDILVNARPEVKIRVTNPHGPSVIGYLPQDSDAVKYIKAIRNPRSETYCHMYIWWDTPGSPPREPFAPCPLERRKGVEWYLVYLPDGSICVKHQTMTYTGEYFIAEMTADSPYFDCSKNSIIEIV